MTLDGEDVCFCGLGTSEASWVLSYYSDIGFWQLPLSSTLPKTNISPENWWLGRCYHIQLIRCGSFTLPETNIAPQNGWLESVGTWISFWGPAYFHGRLLLVLGRVLWIGFFDPTVCHQAETIWKNSAQGMPYSNKLLQHICMGNYIYHIIYIYIFIHTLNRLRWSPSS